MSGTERPPIVKEHLTILEKRGWLARTSEDFRQAVLQRVTFRKLASGEAIYRSGDGEGGLWAIVEGGVQFEIPGPQLFPSIAYVAIPGFWFGETPLINNAVRHLEATTTQPSICAGLALADCRAILVADPTRWQWIALLANMSYALAVGVTADLLLPTPKQRLVATLLRLSGWRVSRHLTPHPSPIHLTQQQIGRSAILSRTAASGILRELESQGVIAIRYRSIEVIDPEGLHALLRET